MGIFSKKKETTEELAEKAMDRLVKRQKEKEEREREERKLEELRKEKQRYEEKQKRWSEEKELREKISLAKKEEFERKPVVRAIRTTGKAFSGFGSALGTGLSKPPSMKKYVRKQTNKNNITNYMMGFGQPTTKKKKKENYGIEIPDIRW